MSANYALLPLRSVLVDPDNVRDDDTDDVEELAASISAVGLLQPIVVYPVPDGWRLSAGHRRLRAMRRLGWEEARCLVVDAPVDELARIDRLLAENLHRRPLNPMEEARGYARYRDAGLTQAEIAQRVSRAQSHVSTLLLFLTELTDAEQAALTSGELTVAAANALMKERRMQQGRARTDAGKHHRRTRSAAPAAAGPHGHSVPHFASSHPLHDVAARACERAAHPTMLKLNGACGVCWEAAIRRDERIAAELDGPDPVERHREVVKAERDAVLHCVRCGKDGSFRHHSCRFTRSDGTTAVFPHHDYRYVPAAQRGAG